MSAAPDDHQSSERAQGSAGAEYLPALDALRALAAAWVVVYHCWIRTGAGSLDGLGPLAPLVRSGSLGVDVFFVLSGAVLTLGLLRRAPSDRRLWPFVIRRGARLFPAVWVVLVAAVATANLHMADLGLVRRAITPESVVANATLLGGVGRLLPGYDGAIGFAVNPVIWSLTPEVLFSLVLVAILPVVVRWPTIVLGGLVAGGVVLRALDASAQVVSVAGPLLTAFPVGIAVALLARRPQSARTTFALVGGGVLTLALVVAAQTETGPKQIKDALTLSAWLPVAVAVGAGAVCLGLTSERGRRWTTAPLTAAGRWSYGIYLWHFPIIGLIVWTGGLPADGSTRSVVVAFLIATPLAIGAGAASFRFVESPARRLTIDRLAASRSRPEPLGTDRAGVMPVGQQRVAHALDEARRTADEDQR
ncbi:MAG: acyltransferase [Solirubrobacteraceae bacterium]|nr:acyltransferase [Solirubrobacteraceae bacterium]